MGYSLLDLFCGAGGCSVGYHRAGFDKIVGIDIKPQKHYPFEFVQADALEYCAVHGCEFDAIHASPPCQHYSSMQHITKNRDKWPDLIGPVRELLISTGKTLVIENVVGAPIRIDLLLCGSMFGLNIIRHRIFESNVPMPLLTPTCHHDNVYDPWHKDGVGQREKLSEAMGIDWFMTRPEDREAIPPAYTEYIGKYLLGALSRSTPRHST